MERAALSDLIAWKAYPHRKPLILNGARQVGKTRLLASNLDVDRLLLGLRVEAGCPIEPERTLIIFDEIQDNPRALTALKYFAETVSGYHVAAAGSLLGVALHELLGSGPLTNIELFRPRLVELLRQ
jgi:predicted AAA+ superfamily ATPase